MPFRLVATLLLTLAAGRAAQAGDVAIVVHPGNEQDATSLTELTHLFRLDQQHWKNGDKVDLILQASGSAKEAVMLDKVFRMKADELKPFWLGKVFRGELAAEPRMFASDASVKKYVAEHPRAVGYIDAALLDDTVKAMSVDGKRPEEDGYVLARRTR
jgi:hypothetical protein